MDIGDFLVYRQMDCTNAEKDPFEPVGCANFHAAHHVACLEVIPRNDRDHLHARSGSNGVLDDLPLFIGSSLVATMPQTFAKCVA